VIKGAGFEGNTLLVSIDFPTDGELRKIGVSSCSKLRTVELSPAVTVIPDSCFEHCDLRDAFVVPRSVTTIQDRAFHGNKRLTAVEIDPESRLTLTGKGSFSETAITKLFAPRR
jgi:hypothetical protein